MPLCLSICTYMRIHQYRHMDRSTGHLEETERERERDANQNRIERKNKKQQQKANLINLVRIDAERS